MHKQKNKKTLKIILLLALVVGIIIFLINLKTNGNGNEQNSDENRITNKDVKSNSTDDNYGTLIGTFVYSVDGTHYEFKKDGTGSMSGTGFNYKYKYTTNEDVLKIDYEAEEVHDAEYTYKIDGNTLTLKAKNGTETIGKEYKLEKENK